MTPQLYILKLLQYAILFIISFKYIIESQQNSTMSNKNLKVYRIQFITEVKDMQFKVKFPCQIKMIWKRSNESAETSLKPVENGVVHFNQTLKMYVNMYFDTTINKFVEKKCMYSFLIITDKGQKSAGNVTYDLAEFFNKRKYEIEEEFPLQKCPLPDTKIKMKIYYEESTQTGYDSMSRISTSSQLDISTASLDVQEFQQENKKKSGSQIQQSKSKKSEEETASKEVSQKQQEGENYDILNQSDLGPSIPRDSEQNNGGTEKITQNIQALNKITGKINDFVSRCSGNIKNEIENLKHKNKVLEENNSTYKFQIEKLQQQKQTNNNTISQLKKELSETKISYQSQIKRSKQSYEELENKYQQSQKLCHQLEKNLQEKGQSQSSYISQLKINHQQNEKKLKEKVQGLNEQIIQEKKQKHELQEKVNKLQSTIKQLKEKLSEAQERNSTYETKEIQRQRQLTDLRYKLENVYQQIVKSFGNIVQ